MGLLNLKAQQLGGQMADPAGIEALRRRAAELADIHRAMGGGARIPVQKEAVPALRLREMFTHPDVKARGIKHVNALRKDLADQGYTIDETK